MLRNRENQTYEPHLELRSYTLAEGGEWAPPGSGWMVCRIESGDGYWLRQNANRELVTGSVIVRGGKAEGVVRATQLRPMTIAWFQVQPWRLNGLLSLDDAVFFENTALNSDALIFGPASPAGQRAAQVLGSGGRAGCIQRARLLGFFLECFEDELKGYSAEAPPSLSVRDRLRGLLEATPAADLAQMNFTDVCQRMGCTARHLSRTFQSLIGVSFREKQTELRLSRAKELLATTDCKVIEAALESGYQSLSVFNMIFRQRFGISPGKWRKEQDGWKRMKPRVDIRTRSALSNGRNHSNNGLNGKSSAQVRV